MRKLTVLLLLLFYAVSLAGVSAFAAIANKTDTRVMAGVNDDNAAATSQPSGTSNVSLGFLCSSPGFLLETSDYDLQHNSRMGRQVARGTDGRVHFLWTYRPLAGPNSQRAVHYRSYLSGSLSGINDVSGDGSKTTGRFCNLDVWGVKALPVWHYAYTTALSRTSSALDAGSGSQAFTYEDTPSSVLNCEGIQGGTTFDQYIWPVVASDYDGAGNVVVHVVAMEGNTSAGWDCMTYFRGVPGQQTFQPDMYGTCGMFVDSLTATAYDVAADPWSDRVVIAYPRARSSSRSNNDLGYILSTNLGQTWGSFVNITNYPTNGPERINMDCSVLFASDGAFHIISIVSQADTAAGTYSDEAKLIHWSSATPSCISLILDGNNRDANCNTTAFDNLISDINISQCIVTDLDMDPDADDTLLYAVYTRYLGTTANPDCSDKNYYNGEIFASVSSTWGETWGAPVNLTNSPSDGCTGGNCCDDHFSTCARYNVDSLNIEYMSDLDAGSFVGNESSTMDLMNPVMGLIVHCFEMSPYQSLSCSPSRIFYPEVHSKRGQSVQKVLKLTNAGNQSATWSHSIAYTGGPQSGWLSLAPGGGTVLAGCTNSMTTTMTAQSGGGWTETLYKAEITFTYGTKTSFIVPVEYYVFDSWFLPENQAMRTTLNRMVVNQVQVADDQDRSSFSYFANLSEDYITDGSLILGSNRNNTSFEIFHNGQGEPTPDNPFGYLYALSNTTYDSTTFDSYRYASGKGTNRDSTVGFDAEYYAPKHIDSTDFYVAHIVLYKGVNSNPATGLTIAYGTDWDVPSDTGSNNTAGKDEALQMIYLQGQYSAARQQGFGALSVWRDDKLPIYGGFSFDNDNHVYDLRGFQVDSLWNWFNVIMDIPKYRPLPVDSIEDQSIVMIVAKGVDIGATDSLAFNVIFAAQRGGSYEGLQGTIAKAKKFICDHVAVGTRLCQACTMCGDANGDATFDISDAVFLIQYIFVPGSPAPGPCGAPDGLGDANGDTAVDISDAVYLIQYIFVPGSPAPLCP